MGTFGTGQILTTPEHIWHNIQLNGVEREIPQNNSSSAAEPENIKKSKKVEYPKSSSRLINRLLKTLNLPGKLEAAMTFSSG